MKQIKTTVLIDEQLYKKLVMKSIEKYGSTKNISKLLNELLKKEL
ncbi:MAG: hypothetical protein V1802_02775 [Candidatus Aenigmatarchaeota archaeon]